MTETPRPPIGCNSFLDMAVAECDPHNDGLRERAAAELAALRAERDRLRELLGRAWEWVNGGNPIGLTLKREIERELAK